MALKGMLSFDFTGTGKLKTLFGTGFCFHLRHLVPIFGLSRLFLHSREYGNPMYLF